MQLTSLTYFADCMTYADYVALRPEVEVTFQSNFPYTATELQLTIAKFFVIKATCRALVLLGVNEVPTKIVVSSTSSFGYFPAFYLVTTLELSSLTTNGGIMGAATLSSVNNKIAEASVTRFDKVYGDNPSTKAQIVSFCGAVS